MKKQLKPLDKLSEVEFESLKSVGILWELYPDSPEFFKLILPLDAAMYRDEIEQHLDDECGDNEFGYSFDERLIEIDLLVKKNQMERDVLQDVRKSEIGNTTTRCLSNVHGVGCNSVLEIKDLTYLRQMYYVDDVYTGYFTQTEGGFKCPKCGLHNRLLDHCFKGSEFESEEEKVTRGKMGEYPNKWEHSFKETIEVFPKQ